MNLSAIYAAFTIIMIYPNAIAVVDYLACKL